MYMNIAINWMSAKWVGTRYCLWLHTCFQRDSPADVKRLICIQYEIYSVSIKPNLSLLFSVPFFKFIFIFCTHLNRIFLW